MVVTSDVGDCSRHKKIITVTRLATDNLFGGALGLGWGNHLVAYHVETISESVKCSFHCDSFGDPFAF